MRSIAMKFIAILLATLCLAVAICSGLGMIYLSEFDLYEQPPAQAELNYLETMTRQVAWNKGVEYAAETFGGVGENRLWMLEDLDVPALVSGNVVHVEVALSQGTEGVTVEQQGEMLLFKHTLTVDYPVIWEDGEPNPGFSDVWGEMVWQESRQYWLNGEYKTFHFAYYPSVPLEVSVLLRTTSNPWQEAAALAYALRHQLPLIIAGCLLLFVIFMVYLCWAAGKKKGLAEIRPGGLNRIPLDLYIVADCILGYWGLLVLFEAVPSLVYSSYDWLALVLALGVGIAICALCICFVFTFAAQVKAKGFWWKHSVIGWCCIRIFRAIRWVFRGLRAVFRLLPVIWQWLLTAAAMAIMPLIFLAFATRSGIVSRTFWVMMVVASVFGGIALVLYGGYAFGTLLQGVREMAQGKLDKKIDTAHLYGNYGEFGDNLNDLSQAAMVAAREQMKSERMKTELITNVSHDIKTPLTSLINYVDLLQKPHTEEEEEQYLEVLSRQSLRLKKLIDDLMEMSKASTGNVAVELENVDVSEAVLQALGEYGDKLDAVPLSIVFHQPENPVLMRADGRLAWRVMSNLLQNAVKYSLPGTRLYVDVAEQAEQVQISFKNISRESLNISAEELMERFVRGDVSRNTEGSGLGLNIAQGLMEVQGGSLHLTVDGDLFKVTLSFPAA